MRGATTAIMFTLKSPTPPRDLLCRLQPCCATLAYCAKPPRGDDQYARAYGDLGLLQALALECHLAIVVLHHTNKLASPDDPLDAVLGSTGIVGTADVKAVLTRARTATTSGLFITGRDVQERHIALDFSGNRWTLTDQACLSATAERKAIMALLDKALGLMRPKDIALATQREEGATRVLLRKMLDDGQVASPKYGYYCSIKHPSNTGNSCHENRTDSGTQCYRPPATVGNTGNASSENPDVLPSEVLPLDSVLPPPGNSSSGINSGLTGKSYQSDRYGDIGNRSDAALGIDHDIADVFGVTDVTAIENEPPDDMLNVPRDPDADKVRTPTEEDCHLRLAAEQSRGQKAAVLPAADEPLLDNTCAAGMGKPNDSNGYEEDTI